MRKIFFTLGLIILFSCNRKQDKDVIVLETSFNRKIEICREDVNELKHQNIFILKNINSYDNSSLEIDSYFKKYINYLDSIQKLCTNNQNPFFKKSKEIEPTELGKDFIKKSNQFLDKLNDVAIQFNLKKRASLLLNVEDFEYNEDWYIVYLDYHFFNTNCEAFHFLIETRKRDVLMIENQILYEILLNQYKKEYIINGNTLK